MAPLDPARASRPRPRRSATCAPRAAASAATRTRSPRPAPARTPRWSRPRAVRDGDGWVLNGEKWHVTSGDVADFLLVHAHVDGDPAKATVFLVDKDLPGVRVVRTPKYMHTFVFEHPIFAFDDVRVGDDAVLGEVGQGYELTKDWFVEERHHDRRAHRRRRDARARPVAGVRDRSACSSARRSSSTRPSSSCSPTWRPSSWPRSRCCTASRWQAARGGTSRKELHALASAVKLVCSETAGRVIDKAVQIHGGRGYMREQPVERMYRELRVDRIWEGTSEIQRMVIGNELRKRGAGASPAGRTERPPARTQKTRPGPAQVPARQPTTSLGRPGCPGPRRPSRSRTACRPTCPAGSGRPSRPESPSYWNPTQSASSIPWWRRRRPPRAPRRTCASRRGSAPGARDPASRIPSRTSAGRA